MCRSSLSAFPVNSFTDRCCTDCGGAACGVPPGSAAKPGDWNVSLMEASFDAIINETTLFDGGITGAKDQLVLVRGYPGPLGTPFAKITTTMPGPNPRGPNATITVPTWAGPSSAAELAGGSVAGAWAQGVAAETEAPEPPEVGQCGSVLHDYCEPHLDLLCEFAPPERSTMHRSLLHLGKKQAEQRRRAGLCQDDGGLLRSLRQPHRLRGVLLLQEGRCNRPGHLPAA